MKKTIAMTLSHIRDPRPPLAVLWCMKNDDLWPTYASTLPNAYNIQRYDIHQDKFPASTAIERVYISGSEMSIQDKNAASVKTYIAAFIAEPHLQKRIAGTCFGAQALAKWALNKQVLMSFAPEENLFRPITINGKEYNGHFNHAWFIIADTETNWQIQSQKAFSIVDAFAKSRMYTCVDIFSATIGQIEILGILPHPHISPPTGQNISPIVDTFFGTADTDPHLVHATCPNEHRLTFSNTLPLRKTFQH